MQSKPTIGYWCIRAGPRGAIHRWIMAYAKADYNGKWYTFDNKEEWGAQDKMNLGLDFPNLPYVQNGDFNLTECKAVAWYLADKYAPKLLGANVQDKACIDMYYHRLNDSCMAFVGSTFRSEDRNEICQIGVAQLESWAKCLGKKNWLVGNCESLADLLLFELIETVCALHPTLFQQCPSLEAYHARIKALPGICDYMASPDFIAKPFNAPFAKTHF